MKLGLAAAQAEWDRFVIMAKPDVRHHPILHATFMAGVCKGYEHCGEDEAHEEIVDYLVTLVNDSPERAN